MALEAAPGSDRDRLLTMALADGGALRPTSPLPSGLSGARAPGLPPGAALPWLGTETGG